QLGKVVDIQLALFTKTNSFSAIHAVPIGRTRGCNANVIKFAIEPCHETSPGLRTMRTTVMDTLLRRRQLLTVPEVLLERIKKQKLASQNFTSAFGVYAAHSRVAQRR